MLFQPFSTIEAIRQCLVQGRELLRESTSKSGGVHELDRAALLWPHGPTETGQIRLEIGDGRKSLFLGLKIMIVLIL